MNETIDAISSSLGKLYGLPGYALVTVFCIVAGYVLRGFKKFPNEAIPLSVVLIGMVLNSIIAEAAELPFRIWLVKNVVFGGICGFVAFVLHHTVISKIEAKFGKSDDTQPKP